MHVTAHLSGFNCLKSASEDIKFVVAFPKWQDCSTSGFFPSFCGHTWYLMFYESLSISWFEQDFTSFNMIEVFVHHCGEKGNSTSWLWCTGDFTTNWSWRSRQTAWSITGSYGGVKTGRSNYNIMVFCCIRMWMYL